jgi:ligand-binding SRPBCC domain-containing protein
MGMGLSPLGYAFSSQITASPVIRELQPMQTIHLETTIAAPIDRCFLLSLSIDLHKASTIKTHEEAIAGVTSGIIGPNQTVTWRARHFGLMLTHATLISEYTQPTHFQDIMTKGAFKTFVHDHDFEALPDGTTLMRDTLRFSAPLGPLGLIAETLVLRRYLSGFLQRRNDLIAEVAESPKETWRQFLPAPE